MSTIPNWVSNALLVEDKEFVEKVVQHRNSIDFGLLETFLPTPPPLTHVERGQTMVDGRIGLKFLKEGTGVPLTEAEIKAHQDLYGSADWLDWRQRNWGTNREAYRLVIEVESEDRAVLRFDTAWAPPVDWLKQVVKGYGGKFTLAYAEGGFGFWGQVEFQGGVQVEQWEKGDFWVDDDAEVPSPEVQSFIHEYGLHTGC